MKTKTLLILMSLITALSLSGCFSSIQPPDNQKEEVLENSPVEEEEEVQDEGLEEELEEKENAVAITITDVTFLEESKQLTFTVENVHETETLQYGLAYDVERIGSSGEWIMTGVTDSLYFPAVLIEVPPLSKKTDTIDLSQIDFITGTFRIVRPYMVGDQSYLGYLSFSIDEFMDFDNFSSDIQ